ncbi:hypothetical protein KSF_001200 [Reticulibacter mediterranei]|uniref:HTH cro/C1-type domain-containing protein n=1 Tax=Reticulibacter mediterranei TaxID=2778369 RepID=A0A8J3IEE4_9CHLR|nr:helix-turn-helix domain-containing protein [Reticulibacter mediterranei]GHO90072.1 hypothetical protein KSF_001200 [Reticulibacter mediterranei]
MQQDEQVTFPPSHLRSLGGLLRWHRLRLGLSQEALAEAIGVSARSIGRWEQNLALPQEIFRERLGQLFGMNLQHFLAVSAIQKPEPPLPSLPAWTVDLLPASSQPGILLLKSKLCPPQLPCTLVRRECLLTQLDAACEHQLIVLCAAAGWGKTTLLSSWATRYPRPIAWVSLNELDSDPNRFWGLVIAALKRCGSYLPTVGETALAMLHSSQPPTLTTVLTALIQEMEDTVAEAQAILILDDYQVIEDPTIHESLLFLLEHLPASLHLVLSSRIAPALPLSRWRLSGQVLELHDAELRFTPEEARRFLQEAMGCSLTQEEVQLLQERTEGWIAGLQLAALAMRGRQDRSAFVKTFGGGHRLLLDYVQEEIFQRQPLHLQHFLLQTAVLTQMNAAVCQAITGEQTSQLLLEAMERAHLFVVALDEERHWYRFHCLFREALLARLHASQPEQVPLLHQRAAHWYEEQGDIHEAMAHALAAADYHFAVSLIERAAERLWMNGGAKTVQNWVKQLPDAVLRAHALLALTAALHLLDQTQYAPPAQRAEGLAQVEQTIARVENLLKSQEGIVVQSGTDQARLQAEELLLRQRIRLLYGLNATREAYLQGNKVQLHLTAQRMQEEVLEDDVTWMMIPTFSLLVSFAFHGDVNAALPRLLEMKQRACQAQHRFATFRTMFWVTVVHLASGQLHQAYQECLQALEMLKQQREQVPAVGYLYLELAALHWMWNQLEEAHTCLCTVIDYARTWQNTDLLLLAYCRTVQVLLAAGKSAEAEQTLEEAERLAQHSGFVLHRPRVRAARVQLWLAQGNLAAAGAWASNYELTPDALEYIREPEYKMLVCVYLAQQQYRQAQQLLMLLLPSAQGDGRGGDVVSLLALQVVALQASGEVAQARQVAAHLLSLTEPEGYLRVYLDAGEPMQQVLQSLLESWCDQQHSSAVTVSYLTQLVAAFT